ncbi:MAG: carbohydrate binding family 9 domain-containing protein, partial [Ignavibacteriales bacterium]|nr:carbohydrate binding family 9 domain-containing protein [Ignavibacteriales bacterium]
MKFRILLFFLLTSLLYSQTLKVGRITSDYNLDGILSEPFWNECDSIPNLTMVEPIEGSISTFTTIVKIVVNRNTILVGIKCFDEEPDKIVAYSKARDVNFSEEDYIKIVIDTYMDARSGYVFAINPYGARSDGLLYPMGYESKSWDGVWDATTAITNEGWSAEIYIPVTTLNFPDNISMWSFNIERKIQRLLETNRWAGINKNYQVIKTSQAGKITNIPKFDLGLALLVKLSTLGDIRKEYNEKT